MNLNNTISTEYIFNILWVFFQYLTVCIFGKCDKHDGFQFYYISFQSNKILYNKLKN